MARFYVTNSAPVRRRLEEGWKEAGLRSAPMEGDLYAASAKKRSIEHVNAASEGPDRWLIATGSYGSFEDGWGGEALPQLLRRFDPSAPLKSRSDLFGHYGVAVRQGGSAFVFCDPIASYEIYVAASVSGDFLVATSLSDCMKAPWAGSTIGERQALVAAFHGERGLGWRSTAEGVLSLRGHQYAALTRSERGWRLDLRRAERTEPRRARGRFGDAVEAYAQTTRSMLQVAKRAGRPAVNATGGLDSRLVLAAAKEAGMAGHLLYGKGNSALTNTRRQDRVAAQDLARYLGSELTVMDWSGHHVPHERRRRLLRQRYGFKLPYGGTERIIEAFEGGIDPYPDLQLAGYGPGFTNARIWSWQEPVGVREFAKRYASAYLDVFRSAPAREAYLDHVEEAVGEIAEAAGVPVKGGMITPEAAVALWASTKTSKESFNVQAFNEFCYYLAPHFTSQLQDQLLAVPPEWREGDRFQLTLIAAHDSGILDVPIYSGTRHYVLDRANMTVGLLEGRRDPASLLRRIRTKALETWEARQDRSETIRAELLEALRPLCGDDIDPEKLATKDARAVFRFMTAREMASEESAAREMVPNRPPTEEAAVKTA
ncbi:hypothetical protein [Parvularcula maris]|uniref:Uncharacterized protein n=1 Tax=Parvularcula maris TaxID=2965077 RepID=A0A9X2L9B2_9PROT|nr:hypothetical protein [Parvularcula maris]MCQ8185495.1 hypothetical protein [Parvularcula maris]